MKKENNKKMRIPEGYINGKDFVTFVQNERLNKTLESAYLIGALED